MMKRIILTIVMLCALVIIYSISSTLIKREEPVVSLKFTVESLSDKEFALVETNGLENPKKDDFKKVEFALNVSFPSSVSGRRVVIPDIKHIANSYDRERYWFGENYVQDNAEESFAKYGDEFVFYSKGLDKQTIKNIFNSAEVKISWNTSNNDGKTKLFKLGDIVRFK